MVLPSKFKVAFKTISVLVAGIFLWNQVAWAGDLINAALEQQYKDQSQTFAPSYLQNQQSSVEALISQKQTIEDTITTQNLLTSADTQPPDDESIDLKGPRGGGESSTVTQSSVETQASSVAGPTEDPSIITVTTETGDVVHYKGDSIDSIERNDGAVLNSITLDGDNNLVGAEITYSDGTIQTVAGGKVSQVIKPDGTILNYNEEELISFIIYPDGQTADCSCAKDGQGNIIEIILTDSDKTSRYDSNNRLTRVEFNTGKTIEYNSGVISKITELDNSTFIFDIKNNPDNTITSSLSQYVAVNGTAYRYSIDSSSSLISVVVEKNGLIATYNKEGVLSGVTKNGQAITLTVISQSQADYDAALAVYQNRRQDVQNLQINFNAAGADLAVKTSAKDTAQTSLGLATQALTSAQSTKDTKQTAYTNADNDYLAAQTTYNSANTALNNAKTLETTASQALTTAQTTFNAKQATLNTRIAARQALQTTVTDLNTKIQTDQTSLAQAQQSLTQALTDEQTSQTAYNTAQTDLNAKQTSYNSAVQDRQTKEAVFNTANTSLTTKTNTKNQADTALQSAIQALTSAQTNKNTKQAAYNLAYAAYLSSQSAYNQALAALNNAQADEIVAKNETDVLFSSLNILFSISSSFPSQDNILANADKKLDIISVLYDAERRIKTVHSIDGTTQNYTEGLPNDILLNNKNELIIDRDGIKRIYDEYGNLSSVTANGISATFNNGRVSRVQKEDGTIIENALFDANNNMISAVVTKPDGVKAVYDGGVVREIDQPDGGKLYYDAEGNITSSIDSKGRLYSYTRIEEGGISYTQAEDEDGNIINYRYIKDSSGKVITTIANDGKIVTTYDESNNIVKTEVLPTFEDPIPTVSEYKYGRIRNVYKGNEPVYEYTYEFGPGGKEITVIKDVKTGDLKRYKDEVLTSITDKNNLITSYEYNSDGRISKSTLTYLGKAVNQYVYTYHGDNKIIEDMDGIKRTYDKNDKITYLEEGGMTYAYTYIMGQDNREETSQGLIKARDESGSVANYDKGILVSVIRPDGVILSDIVSDSGEVSAYSVLKDGVKYFIEDEYIMREVKGDGTVIDYNIGGLIVSVTDPMGKITQYSYEYSDSDQVEYIIATNDELKYRYDKDGAFVEIIDSDDNYYYYDASDRLIKVINQNAREYDFTYTGNISSVYSPDTIKQNIGDMDDFLKTKVDTDYLNTKITLDRDANVDYGDGSDGDLRVEAGQTVTIDGTKNYKSIYVAAGATLTVSPWNGSSGGNLQIKCLGSAVIDGFIVVDAMGYRGISGTTTLASNNYYYVSRAMQGESFNGSPSGSSSANYGGGGGGGYARFTYWSLSATGAGGSYGTSGGSGSGGGRLPTTGGSAIIVNTASAGSVYGDPALSTMYMGSAGGASYQGSAGGSGGGIVKLTANNIVIKGAVSSNGGNGSSGAGGGSGGTVWIEGRDVNIGGAVSAIGGSGSGMGGDGRIRIDYGTFTGNMPTPTPYMHQMPYQSQGELISQPMAVVATEYGYIFANVEIPAGADIIFMTRTGVSADVNDGSWSDWIESVKDNYGYKASSPVNKYIQYQAILKTTDTMNAPSINFNGDYAVKLSYLYNKTFDATAPPADLIFKEFLKLTPPSLPIVPQIENLAIDSAQFSAMLPEIENRFLPDDTIIQVKSFKDDLGHDVALQISKDNKFIYLIDGKIESVHQKYGDEHIELIAEYSYDDSGNLMSVNLPSARASLDAQISTARQQIAAERANYLRSLAEQKGLAVTQVRDQVQVIRDQIISQRSSLQSQMYQEVTKSRWVGWWIFGWWETYRETVEVPGVRDAINQLNEQERQLNNEEANAYAQLDSQVAAAMQQLNQDEETALAEVARQESKFQSQIIAEEATPVILEYYRSILGRDPDDTETQSWLDTVNYNSKIDAGILKNALLNSQERAEQEAFVVGLKNRISNTLYDYISLDEAGKGTLLGTLGLSDSEAVRLNAEDIDAILSLLEKQNIHFGRSAFVSVGTILTSNGITYNLEDLALKTILIDIFTGSLNALSENKLLELSMYSLSKAASIYGLTLNNTRLNYDELTQAFNSSGQVIAHLKNNHYVVVTNIAADGTISYIEHNRGKNGYTWTSSREDFEKGWTGYAIAQKTSLKGALPETLLAKTISAEAAQRIKGSCLEWLFLALAWFCGGIAAAATAGVGAITAIVASLSAIIAPIIAGVATFITNVAGVMIGFASQIFSGISFVGSSLLSALGPIGGWLGGIGSFLGNTFGLGGVISSTGFNIAGIGIAIGKTIVTTALSIGISKGLEALGVNSTISGLLSSFVTGGVSGLFNSGLSAFSFVTGGLQGLAIQGVSELAPRLGIDPMLSNVISLTAGSIIGAVGNNISPTTGQFNLEGFSASIGKQILPSVTSEFAYYGITKAGELLGVDPRISYLAGVGIRSTLDAGLTHDFMPDVIWGSVTQGLLQGVTNIGLNFATEELGISPLLANIGFSAISGAINAGIQAATSGSKDVFGALFKTYTDNALTFLGSGDPSNTWQQAAYISQILDFSNIVQQRGLADALNSYGAGFFNAVAVNQIIGAGYSLGGYFAEKLNTGQYGTRTLQDGTQVKTVVVKDAQGNTITTVFFEQKQNGEIVYYDVVGKEDSRGDGTYLGWGELGVDPYGKLGYTDADLYSIFNSDTQFQRIEDGLQTYAEIKDSQGNTLLVIEPTENGHYNIYDSYGEYVDAKINTLFNGKTYSFDDTLLKHYQELDSTNNTSLFDVDFSDPEVMELLFNNLSLSSSDIASFNFTPEQKQQITYVIFNGIGNTCPDGVAPAYMTSFAQQLAWADPSGATVKSVAMFPHSGFLTIDASMEDVVNWIANAYLGSHYLTNDVISGMQSQFNGQIPSNIIGVAYSGSGDPFIQAVNENPSWDVKSIVLMDTPIASGRKITNSHVNNVIMITGMNDLLAGVGSINKDFNNNPQPLNVYKIALIGVGHTDFAKQNFNDPTATKVARFSAYTTALANNQIELENFLNTAEGITYDPGLKMYCVDLGKVSYEN